MSPDEIAKLISRLRDGVEQEVALECQCENLETVYVRLDETGRVRVDDGFKTFQYLAKSGDDTYLPVEDLDLKQVRKLVSQHRAELIAAEEEGYPCIECRLRPGQPIAEAVERTSLAIDAVFDLAMRPEFKSGQRS